MKDSIQIMGMEIGERMSPAIGDMLENMTTSIETMSRMDLGSTGSALAEMASSLTSIMTMSFGDAGSFSPMKAFFDSIKLSALEASQLITDTERGLRSIYSFVSGTADPRIKELQSKSLITGLKIKKGISQFGVLDKSPNGLSKPNIGGVDYSTLFGGSGSGGGSGVSGSSVSSSITGGGRGGGSITVNIENVINEQNINGTTGLGSTAEQIKEQVTRALQQVFTEVRIAAG